MKRREEEEEEGRRRTHNALRQQRGHVIGSSEQVTGASLR